MSIGMWVVVGLVAGFLASKFVIKAGDGILRDLALGVAGAVVGGLIFRALTSGDATGVNVPGVLMTFAGAVAALVVYHRYFVRAPEPKRVRRAGAK
jgi:uncharacterized membrane protein YeaQ/YmgE (transglycosylase-associated protein family)